jgi:hypothetical protein
MAYGVECGGRHSAEGKVADKFATTKFFGAKDEPPRRVKEKGVVVSSPVPPKTFPRGNSHMPARSCARPPQKTAIPTTTLGCLIPRVWKLYSESINVVDAKENRPLYKEIVSQMPCNMREENSYSAPGLPILDGRTAS